MTKKRANSGSGDLGAYLSAKRDAVDAALDRRLPDASEPPARLHEAMRYSVYSGGKRLRPILAIATFELLGGDGEAELSAACATELIHTYSLIHDDLPAMDDDDIRRGRPACHRAFDEATAILAGDGLLTLAFEIVARDETLSPETRLAIIETLALANGDRGMVGGQAADIEGEGAEPTLSAVDFIHSRKTGRPIRAAVRVGALAAGAGEDDLRALSSYGEKVGLAFQIADDVLDETGSEEEMGKAVGKDRAGGKMTYPSVVGLGVARARADELVSGAVSDLERFGERGRVLSELARFMVDRRR